MPYTANKIAALESCAAQFRKSAREYRAAGQWDKAEQAMRIADDHAAAAQREREWRPPTPEEEMQVLADRLDMLDRLRMVA